MSENSEGKEPYDITALRNQVQNKIPGQQIEYLGKVDRDLSKQFADRESAITRSRGLLKNKILVTGARKAAELAAAGATFYLTYKGADAIQGTAHNVSGYLSGDAPNYANKFVDIFAGAVAAGAEKAALNLNHKNNHE